MSSQNPQDSGNQKGKGEPLAHRVLKDILDSQAVIFTNQYGEPFIAPQGNGKEIYKLTSQLFGPWISSKAYDQYDQPISRDGINTVCQTLYAKAISGGVRHTLSVRTAWLGDVLWYDLSDGRAIRIDSSGWTISDEPPILFASYGHQQTQVEPVHGGSLTELESLINLANPKDQLLFLVYLIAAFIPGFAHPLIVLHGPQGAGKTTPLRMIKQIIDPSALGTLSAPRRHEAMIQQAAHHAFLFYDNLSSMPEWMSDALARLSTGEGFAKRQLYTDDSDIIYNLQRPIGLTGIIQVVEKADLLDRSILLELARIPKSERLSEVSLWSKFDAIKPNVLGAIFDAIAKAMKYRATVKLKHLPRMADFATWGVAIDMALGKSKEAFIEAYSANIAHQNDAAIEASPVAQAVIMLMDQGPHWSGTPTECYDRLFGIALNNNLDTSTWPRGNNWIWKKLVEASVNLLELGIRIEHPATERPRKIIIYKTVENTDGTDEPTPPSVKSKPATLF